MVSFLMMLIRPDSSALDNTTGFARALTPRTKTTRAPTTTPKRIQGFFISPSHPVPTGAGSAESGSILAASTISVDGRGSAPNPSTPVSLDEDRYASDDRAEFQSGS